MNGIWTGATGDTLICIVFDKRFLTDQTDLGLIYAEFQGTNGPSDPNGAFVNQSGFAHFGKHQKLLIGCSAAGDTGPVKVAQPIVFSFHKVTTHLLHGTPTTVKHAARRGVLAR